MKQQSLKKYPISIQTLEKVIERNYLYIDKMDYIYWMVHDASNYLSVAEQFTISNTSR